MNNRKILIVDDELDICILLSGYLKRAGYEVAYNTSLNDALKTTQIIKPQIIFLDHNLPDGLGIMNIHHFKSLTSCELYIISAMGNLQDEALRNGADHFFEKPLSMLKINNILEKYSQST